jgi:hypothetical protein
MSLVVEVEIKSTDTAVKQCTQALIDCGATGCFIDIEWAKLNNIPTHLLTKPTPVYNIDGTANDASMITDIADVILCYENHSEHNVLGSRAQSWGTTGCAITTQRSTGRVEDKREAKIQKWTTSQINACRAGTFPTMVEEDEDESPHMNMDETDEEVQDTCPAAPVILAVDTSYIAVGFQLCQCEVTTPSQRYYNRFCSITLNDRESKYSQPKLEIYGLYHVPCVLRLYLIGVWNLVVEVNARYIKGILSNPDISPSASINWWIVTILTFHFDLVHIPGTHHGPDGLSRRPWKDGHEEDRDDEEDFADWIDQLHGFMHQINVIDTHLLPTSDSLPLPFPHISTLAQATDLSEEDTSAVGTTDTGIDDYILAPRSVQAKVDNFRLLKVFQCYKILDNWTASLMQSMQPSCSIVWISS